MSSDCVFCKIVAGELPSYKVYEDEDTLAFLDINPVHAGHTLVIPKEHVANIFDMPGALWSSVQETVRKVATAVENGTDAHGVNLLMNNREHAGQVVDHAHVHLIPRFRGDGLTLWPHHSLKKEEGAPIAEKIQRALQ
ncbi:MAG TPA: HIT family protein [Candidatus Paceibacterota bacterium]|nr:HIT family protein [Candidatus Paceibacterota bacterium]